MNRLTLFAAISVLDRRPRWAAVHRAILASFVIAGATAQSGSAQAYNLTRFIRIPSPPGTGATVTLNFSNIPRSATDVWVTVQLRGDYNGTTEYADVTIDGTAPANDRINPSGQQCNSTTRAADSTADNERRFTLPSSITDDNAVSVVVANSSGVSSTLCDSTTNSNFVIVNLSYSSLPDLEITSSTVPVGGGAIGLNELFATKIRVTNIGGYAVAYNTYAISFSYCPNRNPTGCTVLNRNVISVLGSGSTYVARQSHTLPPSIPLGAGYIRTVVDSLNTITESREDNNDDYAPITVVPPRPDLGVVNSVAPVGARSVAAGGTMTVEFDIRNQLVGFTNDFDVYLYQCPEANPTGCNLRRTFRVVDDFAAGEVRSYRQTLTTAPSRAAGTDYLRIQVDALDNLAESDETNNNDYDAFTVTNPTLPDLFVGASIAPVGTAYVASNNDVAVDYTIVNQGVPLTTPFNLALYYCPDANTTGCVLGATRTVADNFASGQQRSYTNTFTLPTTGLATGYVRIFVDSGSAIAEESETNNNRYTTISLRAPDLSVSGSNVLGGASPGQSISFNYDLVNAMTAGAVTQSFSVRHYYCPNATTNGCLPMSADITITDDLVSGQTRSYAPTYDLPLAATVGTRYIRTSVDALGSVAESDETNNDDYAAITVSCPQGFTGASCDSCDADYYGYPSCTYCLASTMCNGVGSCGAAAECVCDPTYAGAACEFSDAITCGGSGVAQDDGTCVCLEGYAGTACQYSDMSTCNAAGSVQDDGSCVCSDGFAGNACQYSDAVTCSGNGVAQDDGSCICAEGTAGPACEFSDAMNCSGNGMTQDDGSCVCSEGYAGGACQYSDAVTCGGNGVAQDDGICVCFEGYAGEGCQYSDVVTCQGHGVAQDDGSCVCEVGYSGEACQYSDAELCSGHGVAQPEGTCICDDGAAGSACEFTDAATCSGNGVAQPDGTCVCQDGFIGDGCDEMPSSAEMPSSSGGCSSTAPGEGGDFAGLIALAFGLLWMRRRAR